jgi:protein-tyrosine phosphatase
MRSIVARRIQMMKTESLIVRDVESDRAAIAAAVARLRQGEVVALPTETVYGLAALPRAEALLRAAKGRDEGKPLTWAFVSREAAGELGNLTPLGLSKLARRFWPGPLTLVAPRRVGHGTIGLRVPGHKVALAVLRQLGEPLLLTSANLAGEPDALDAAAVARTFDGRVPLILDGGPSQLGEASAVVSFEGTRAIVHRQGVIDREMILRVAARHVLFVCSGNTCRSPMADHLARKLWADALGIAPARLLEFGGLVQSAGTSAAPRLRASDEAVELLAERGIDLASHRSRTLDAGLVRNADQIFAMTAAHARAVVELVPEAAAKTQLLDPGGRDIADPIGGGVDVYRSSLDEIERALRERIAQFV